MDASLRILGGSRHIKSGVLEVFSRPMWNFVVLVGLEEKQKKATLDLKRGGFL